MGLLELIVAGVGLSMDAFAAAVCKGLGMSRVNVRHALIVAALFGLFQGLMPVAGWSLGTQFAALIAPIDHWVAFVLLAGIGAKMLWEALGEEDGCSSCSCDADDLDMRELVLLAVATSIDALAVGITFAFLGVNIVLAAFVIGATTFCLSFLGVVAGSRFGARFKRPASVAGGVVLVLIGAKILLEHLGVIVL